MTKELDELEANYLGAITNWHQYYYDLPKEERQKLHKLNEEMHNVFTDMQDIIRITRFGSDKEKQEYSRKV